MTAAVLQQDRAGALRDDGHRGLTGTPDAAPALNTLEQEMLLLIDDLGRIHPEALEIAGHLFRNIGAQLLSQAGSEWGRYLTAMEDEKQ